MRYRRFFALGTAAVLAAIPAVAQTTQPAAKKTWTVPRLLDGHPDFQGIWTNATLTPLERPAQFANKPTLTDAEAAKLEHNQHENAVADKRGATPERDRDEAYNRLFIDRGSEYERVDGVKRTSLIVDPPNGRMPPVTAEATQRVRSRPRNRFDDVKDRPLGERCLLGFGSTSGPPMMPVLYNNNYQIVQTPGTIMILVEMVHDVRFIHMDRNWHVPASVRQWLGDSIGHWEGDTLVVETTNFTDNTHFRGASENMKVTERFTRVDPGTILYKFTIEDPATFTRPWTAEYPFLATRGPIYEYACQEGNYAMTDILGGARKQDQAQSKPPTK